MIDRVPKRLQTIIRIAIINPWHVSLPIDIQPPTEHILVSVQATGIVPPRMYTPHVFFELLIEDDIPAVTLTGLIAQVGNVDLVLPVVAPALGHAPSQRTRMSASSGYRSIECT